MYKHCLTHHCDKKADESLDIIWMTSVMYEQSSMKLQLFKTNIKSDVPIGLIMSSGVCLPEAEGQNDIPSSHPENTDEGWAERG